MKFAWLSVVLLLHVHNCICGQTDNYDGHSYKPNHHRYERKAHGYKSTTPHEYGGPHSNHRYENNHYDEHKDYSHLSSHIGYSDQHHGYEHKGHSHNDGYKSTASHEYIQPHSYDEYAHEHDWYKPAIIHVSSAHSGYGEDYNSVPHAYKQKFSGHGSYKTHDGSSSDAYKPSSVSTYSKKDNQDSHIGNEYKSYSSSHPHSVHSGQSYKDKTDHHSYNGHEYQSYNSPHLSSGHSDKSYADKNDYQVSYNGHEHRTPHSYSGHSDKSYEDASYHATSMKCQDKYDRTAHSFFGLTRNCDCSCRRDQFQGLDCNCRCKSTVGETVLEEGDEGHVCSRNTPCIGTPVSTFNHSDEEHNHSDEEHNHSDEEHNHSDEELNHSDEEHHHADEEHNHTESRRNGHEHKSHRTPHSYSGHSDKSYEDSSYPKPGHHVGSEDSYSGNEDKYDRTAHSFFGGHRGHHGSRFYGGYPHYSPYYYRGFSHYRPHSYGRFSHYGPHSFGHHRFGHSFEGSDGAAQNQTEEHNPTESRSEHQQSFGKIKHAIKFVKAALISEFVGESVESTDATMDIVDVPESKIMQEMQGNTDSLEETDSLDVGVIMEEM